MSRFALAFAAGLVVCSLVSADDKLSPEQVPVQKEPVQSEKQADQWQADPIQKQLHEIHSRWRDRRGIFRQRLDRRLCELAQQWSEHMASVGSMYHSSMGINENVAYGYGDPETTMNVWINSSGHNANLMSSYENVGFGAAQSAGGTYYWTSLHSGPVSDTVQAVGSGGGCSSGEIRTIRRPFGGRFRIRR